MEKSNDTYFLVDGGAYLTSLKYRNTLNHVIERSKKSGIRKIILLSYSLASSKDALRLTKFYSDYFYCTIGVNSIKAETWEKTTYQDLKELALNNECVAIGECGLDFTRSNSPPEVQIQVLEKQIQLAIELNKTLVLYERAAFKELFDLLNKYKNKLPTVFIHNFSGSIESLETYLNAGFFIGLTGYFCKDTSDNGVLKCLNEKKIPLERLIVETNCPFIYPNVAFKKLPENIRKSLTKNSLSYLNRYCDYFRNEPCSLLCIVEMIATFMDESPENVALHTTFNAFKVFNLKA